MNVTLTISKPYEGIKEMLEKVGESQNHALDTVTSLKNTCLCWSD